MTDRPAEEPPALERPPAPEPLSETEETGFFAELRESLRGGERDYTTGGIRRAVLLLAVPMVLEMALESVFAVVDVLFVAELGSAAVAAVGLTEATLMLVFALAIGLSTATTAMVARRIGEKDPEAAAVAAVQALALGIGISVVVGVAGVFGARSILQLMGAAPEVVEVGTAYTAVLYGGVASILLLFLGNAIFRGAGDAAIAMRVLWLANGINIVLDPCLIFGWGPFPELGLLGAAVATTTGRSIGVLYQLVLLGRGRGRIRIRRRHLRIVPSVVARLGRIAVGGILQYLVATASWLAVVRILAVFGSAAVAGYTVALRVILFTILPAWGLSNAAATLVGQNLGAGRPDRAERSTWITARYNLVFLGLVTVVFVLFDQPIVGIFLDDPEAARVGAATLRIIAYCYVFYAFGLVMVQALNGAGDTTTPTIINLVCYWLFQIPLAWLLAHPAGMGPDGVLWAAAAAEVFLSIAGIAVFRRGRWKERVV